MGENVCDETFTFINELTDNGTGLVKDIHKKVQNKNFVETTKLLKRFIL